MNDYYGIIRYKALGRKTVKEILAELNQVDFNTYNVPYSHFIEDEGDEPVSIRDGLGWIQVQRGNKKLHVLSSLSFDENEPVFGVEQFAFGLKEWEKLNNEEK